MFFRRIIGLSLGACKINIHHSNTVNVNALCIRLLYVQRLSFVCIKNGDLMLRSLTESPPGYLLEAWASQTNDVRLPEKLFLTFSIMQTKSMMLPTSTWCSPEPVPCILASGITIWRLTKWDTRPALLDTWKLNNVSTCNTSMYSNWCDVRDIYFYRKNSTRKLTRCLMIKHVF